MTTPWRKHFAALAALFLFFLTTGPTTSRADVPVELTRVGNPIWRPTDFHLFTAPCEPTPEAFEAVADLIVPIPEPRTDPPYDDLLSERLAAAGFQDAAIFVPSDIDGQPSGIYFAHMLIPDPGVTGSSIDFVWADYSQ